MRYPTLRFVFDRKKTATKKHKASVQIEVLSERKRKYIGTGVKLYSDQWDERKKVINSMQMLELNRALDEQIRIIQDWVNELIRKREPFDFEKLERFIKFSNKSENFIEFIERRIEERQDITESTKKNLLEDLLKRSPNSYGKYEASVQQILNDVKEKGDEALFGYTEKFDGVKLDASQILVTDTEIEEAYTEVGEELLGIIRKALVNIRTYHEKQMQYSWFDSKPDGTILGQKVTALQRVGVYVPGGKAAYPSSVLMNIMPAKVAGVDEIIMVTPPGKDGKVTPTTLVAAKEAGADKVYKVGGAQAIGALAYGTESIPKVDKIVGPGNIYVALAKKSVYGHVSIDSIAGPSEILVLADETANPRFVAADLLSQAEHDELASAILVTTSMELAEKVSAQTDAFIKELSRGEIIQKSLDHYGHILVADTLEDAIDAANSIASEHLEIVTANPFEVMTKIRNAGAIFIGEYSSEPLGDYFAGPNHVLPTNGTAKFFSPLSVDDFIKKSSIISYSKDALEKIHTDIEKFAEAEHLTAHANSIKVRFE